MNKLILILAIICILLVSPAIAGENPYRNAHKVTPADVAVDIGSDTVALSDTSEITFTGAEYTHKIGRVSIRMKPLIDGVNENAVNKGNKRTSGKRNVVDYEVYRDLIKEQVVLNSPETIRYSYDLALSDWETTEPDLTQPEVTYDANKTKIVTYPHTKKVKTYAKDSTIDIGPDAWGNLVVYVNDADIVVIPKPFATDATGRQFDLDYELDKTAKTITITGDLSGAQYPLTIDPTERVTNGGFETGTTDGWTSESTPPPALTIISDGSDNPADTGNYFCLYKGMGGLGPSGYNRIFQTIDYTGVTSLSMAVKIFYPMAYDFGLTDDPGTTQWWNGPFNFGIGFPGQSQTEWVTKTATPTLVGNHSIQFWTYAGNAAGIDSISTLDPHPYPQPHFVANKTAGLAPLTVKFTDTSSGSPTSWSWNFGDGTSSTLQNPVHTFTSSGSYNVSLTVTNSEGSRTETKTNYILIGYPVPSFTASPVTGTSPLTVQFTDTSSGSPYDWFWDFGDGSGVQGQNPVHTYTSRGSYTVTLSVMSVLGSNEVTKTHYITVSRLGPTADFTATPTSGNPPLAVQFTDTSTGTPTSWSWNFGDGGTSTQQNPSHTYPTGGKYTVTLKVTNKKGSDTETKSEYVTVYVYAHNYDFSSLPSTPTASNAANYQSQMGYTADSRTDWTGDAAYTALKDATMDEAIFFFNGHGYENTATGDKGGVLIFGSGDITASSASYPSANSIDKFNNNELKDMLLAVYDACYSATDSVTYGNLVTISRTKGVDNVIGFSGHIGNFKSNYWADKFWERTQNGESIGSAAVNARNDAFWSAWPYLGNDGIDTIVVIGDNPTDAYLQPARYGTV